MANKQISVRISADGGKVLKAELAEIGRVGQASFGQLESSALRAGGGLQNASYQIGDVFTQIAAGTDPMRAVAIQLPQLLGGFGAMGAAAGAAAAILPVLWGMFVGGTDDLKAFEDAIDEANAAINRMAAASRSLSADGLEALRAKYGEVTAEVRRMIETQERADERTARAAVNKASAEFSSMAELSGLESFYVFDSAENRISALARELGATKAEAEAVFDALESLRDAGNPGEQADAYAAVAAALEPIAVRLGDAGGEVNQLVIKAVEAEGAARELQARIEGVGTAAYDAAEQARKIAAAIDSIQSRAITIDVNLRAVATGFTGALAGWASKTLGTMQAIAGGSTPMLSSPLPKSAPEDIDFGYSGSTGGRGGGGGGANRERQEAMREAERIFKATRTEAEKYAEELATIDRLLDGGFLTQDTYNRALDQLKEKFGEVGDAAKGFKDVTDSLKEAILDFAIDGTNSFDQVAKAIQRMALEALLFGEGPLGEFFGGGLLKMFGKSMGFDVPSFDGGGWTGAGARAGGLDGKGGYMAMIHPEELVVDLKRAGRGASRDGGGSGTIVQVNNYSGQEVREDRSRGPNGEDLIRVTVGRQLRSGAHDGALKSRFGVRPPAVKR